jgi:phosphotransferase family enzyme
VARTAIDVDLAREAGEVLGDPSVDVEELAHGKRMSVTARVCRVRCAAETAVVKVVSSGAGDPGWVGSDEPAHPWFWRREPSLYEDGLPGPYVDAGLRAPALLARFERRDGVALWLEDLTGQPGSQWDSAEYRTAARRLGRAQAPYLTGQVEPGSFPWSRDFLVDYLKTWDDVGWEQVDHDDAWDAPLVQAHFSPELRHDLVRLCAERHRMIAWAEQLPQTICHHDVWPKNVFAFDGHTTLIDWAFAGHGHIGADVGNLVTDSCGDLLHPAAMLPELDAATRAGYEVGLQEAGWRGDLRHVRLGMCVMAARWSWLVPHMLRLATEERHLVYGSLPVDSHHLFAERAEMLRYYTVLASEARALALDLGF